MTTKIDQKTGATPAREPNPATDEDALVSRGRSLFPAMKNGRLLVESRWVEDNDYYDSRFSVADPKMSDVLGVARVFIPKTRSRGQLLLADVLGTLLFDPAEIIGVEEWLDVPEEVRQLHKDRLNWRLNGNPINFWQEAYEAAEDAIIRRCAVMKIYPRLKLKRKEKTSFQDGPAPEGYDVVAYEPQIETIRYEDAFFSREATWKDYWKYPICHRVKRTRDYLKRYGYENVDLLTPQANPAATDDRVKAQRAVVSGSPFAPPPKQLRTEEEVYVYEFWDHLDLGDGKLSSCSYALLGGAGEPLVCGRKPVKNTLPYRFSEFEEPRPPIIFGVAYPRSHELYGGSFSGDNRALQQEVNYFAHQDREAVALAVRRPMLVQRDAEIDLSALLNRTSSSVVMGNDISDQAIRELQTGGGAYAGQVYGVRTAQDFNEATSLSPSSLGVQDRGRNVTATEIGKVEQNSGKRSAMMIRCLANTLFVPAFRFLQRLEHAYTSEGEVKQAIRRHLGKKLKVEEGMNARGLLVADLGLRVDVGNDKGAQFAKLSRLLEVANQSNMASAQLAQLGVVSPTELKFADPAFFFKNLLRALGYHNFKETQLEGRPPVTPPGGGVSPTGMASPPATSAPPGTVGMPA